MRLLIFGASGGCGKQLVERALARGDEVTALYRDPSRAGAHAALRALPISDLTELSALASEIASADHVLSCLGNRRVAAWNPWSRMGSRVDLLESFTRALVGMPEMKGKRLTVVSAAGVGESWARVSPPLRALISSSNIGVGYRDLNRMEEVLAASDLDWVAVRPTTLNDGPSTGRVRTVDGYALTAAISRADVAEAMLRIASGERPSVRQPILTG